MSTPGQDRYGPEAAVRILEEIRRFQGFHPGVDPGANRVLLAGLWGRFQAVYSPVLDAQIRGRRLRDADADEVRQNVWVALLARVLHLKPPLTAANLEGWTWRVVENQANDLFRQRVRHPAQPLADVLGTPDEPASQADDPATQDERTSPEERVQALLAALHRRGEHGLARLLSLYYLDGLATEEIAQREALTPANVRKRLERARRMLRDHTTADGFPLAGSDVWREGLKAFSQAPAGMMSHLADLCAF